MDSVLQLLDELEDVMDSSKAVPFSSKVTVNKEEIYDIKIGRASCRERV